jgi:diguanylate cyclase (GGDEF)-like protein
MAVDGSLVRRRRSIEACALVARTVGLLSTAGIAAGWIPWSEGPLSPTLSAVCAAAAAVMAAANALTVAAYRRAASGRAYRVLSIGQVVLDTVVVVAAVGVFTVVEDRTTWPVLVVPVVTAAMRHQLAGALAAWAATSVGYAVAVLWVGDGLHHPGDVFVAVSTHLLVAVATGTQSSSFDRQLTDLQAARAALQHQAGHDPLTGLANRSRLQAYAEELAGRRLAVVLLDLDGFKAVNDTLGHAVGDELLRVVSRRLSACVRPGDLAARLGGDEFVVLMPDADPRAVAAAVQRLTLALREPARLDGRTVAVAASIGTAGRPAGSTVDLAALTAEADRAMYRCKATGRPPVPASG